MAPTTRPVPLDSLRPNPRAPDQPPYEHCLPPVSVRPSEDIHSHTPHDMLLLLSRRQLPWLLFTRLIFIQQTFLKIKTLSTLLDARDSEVKKTFLSLEHTRQDHEPSLEPEWLWGMREQAWALLSLFNGWCVHGGFSYEFLSCQLLLRTSQKAAILQHYSLPPWPMTQVPY